MSLSPTQALVTATISGHNMAAAAEKLRQALHPYPDARIVSITLKTNWLSSFLGETSLLALIEYTPAKTAD